MKSNAKRITSTGLFLALAILFQNLRLIPFLSEANPLSPFVIGSLVNLVIIAACVEIGFWPAALISICTPVVALLQGQLKLPFMVGVVALGNLVLAAGCFAFKKNPKLQPVGMLVGAIAKFGFFLLSVPLTFSWFVGTGVPAAVAGNFLGWAQLITALIGGVLALLILPVLRKIKR